MVITCYGLVCAGLKGHFYLTLDPILDTFVRPSKSLVFSVVIKEHLLC